MNNLPINYVQLYHQKNKTKTPLNIRQEALWWVNSRLESHENKQPLTAIYKFILLIFFWI